MQGGNNFAFIDSQNLYKSIEKQGWKLDFGRFRIYLKEKYGVRQAFLFYGYLERFKAMYEFLEKCGYAIIFKLVLPYQSREPKGNVDAELVLHTMIQYPNFDEAVIVSGDGDFYCLVDYLETQNKLAKLLIPNQHRYSGLLKPYAPNKVQFMNSLKSRLEYINKKSS